MVDVRIPGAEAIDVVTPARDPQRNPARATAEDFGAGIGTSLQHFGDAAVSLSAHLYDKTKTANDQVAENTYRVNAEPAFAQTVLDTNAQFPDGGPEAAQALRDNLQKKHDEVISSLAEKGLSPSPAAIGKINTHFANLQTNFLVQGITRSHNERVASLQGGLDDNINSLKSQVLAGGKSAEDALKIVDDTTKSARALFSGTELSSKEDEWRQGVIDAAIKSKVDAGDLQGADALKAKYYGKTPKFGDSQAAGVAQVANNLGIKPRDLAAVISYETGGKFDPALKGGKGGNYQGLIQFGPEERAKYGVTPGQSFNDQLPAVESFLRDRGVKPGMGLAQIYSVVNAGSLDKDGQPHWARSDGNGNIADHVQRIQRDHYSSADEFLSGAKAGSGGKGVKVASADGSVPASVDANGNPDATKGADEGPVLPNVAKAVYWDGQFRAAGVDQKQAEARQKKAEQEASDNRELEVFKDMHSEQPKISAMDILNDNTLSKPAKEKLFDRKSKLEDGTKTDKTYGTGFFDAYQAVHAADGDPKKITDPSTLYSRVGPNGDLTVAGVDKLVSEIQGRRTPEGVAEGEMKTQFFKLAKSKISGSDEGLHIKDPKGDELYLKFLAQALPAYDAGKKAGKSATQLLDPNSPDYVGKAIEGFRRPMDQWFSDVVRDAPATAGPKEFDVKTVKSLDDLVTAYRAGKVTKSAADQLAVEKGWAAKAPPAARAPVVPVSQ